MLTCALAVLFACSNLAGAEDPHSTIELELPDKDLVETYRRAAIQNVLAAVNPRVFPGYWSVCADGQGYGYGNTYPSLDGHQMTDALLCLGEVETVLANWDYVRRFQRPDGLLPIAILPLLAGKELVVAPSGIKVPVDNNGGLYAHWVPGNPLRALASPTFIQNADVLFRYTQDRTWLRNQLPAINLAADQLRSLMDERGRIGGAGYYLEFPARIEFDGVAQCHAVDAFWRVAALNRANGDDVAARRYDALAEKVRQQFNTRFWIKDRFAEYESPAQGLIASHGLTDTDWAAVALKVATSEQVRSLWPRLKSETGFYYGGMPTGIAAQPFNYQEWEFSLPNDRRDLAAMGRVWYLDAAARAHMGDPDGLIAGARQVSRVGRGGGYFWRERYRPEVKGVTPAGMEKYCEYPANYIRVIQRFVMGVEHLRDGSLGLAPTVPDEFWVQGFGQKLKWRGRILTYRFEQGRLVGSYVGPDPQQLRVKFPHGPSMPAAKTAIGANRATATWDGDWIVADLYTADARQPLSFEITWGP